MPPTRIGINALFLIPGGVGGTEIYLRNLLQALAEEPGPFEYVVFLNAETGPEFVPAHPAFRAVPTGVRASSRPARILFEQFRLPALARRERVSVLFNAGFTSPVLTSIPNVTVLHDLQHHRHPEYFRPADLAAWRFFVWTSARRSRRLVTISDASREDIQQVYGVPAQHIFTAEPGASNEFAGLPIVERLPLVLCVSTLHPHKNIERLVDAFARFQQRRPEYRLVLAGMHGFHGDAVAARVRQHNLEGIVRLTGWIPRSEVLELYAQARIAVFPSTFEGFGIPVVEAMAAGVPLIISGVRPMTDIAGDAALQFPVTSTDALDAAMERLAGDVALREELVARGRHRAAHFTWNRTAAAVRAALTAALE